MSDIAHILFFPVDWIAGLFPWWWLGMLFGGTTAIVLGWWISVPLYKKYVEGRKPNFIRSVISIPIYTAMIYPFAVSIYVSLSFFKAIVQAI